MAKRPGIESRIQVPTSGGWAEWGKHVLMELERLNNSCEKHSKKVRELEIEQAVLKSKAGVWGALGALIPICIALVIALAVKFFGG